MSGGNEGAIISLQFQPVLYIWPARQQETALKGLRRQRRHADVPGATPNVDGGGIIPPPDQRISRSQSAVGVFVQDTVDTNFIDVEPGAVNQDGNNLELLNLRSVVGLSQVPSATGAFWLESLRRVRPVTEYRVRLRVAQRVRQLPSVS